MSDLENLRSEVADLRKNLDAAIHLIRWEVRKREVIEQYLETLTSAREWKPWEKKLNSWLPLWGWFHAWRVLYREPFSVWANDAVTRDANE